MNFPFYLETSFIALVFVYTLIFYRAIGYNKKFALFSIVWLLATGILAHFGFFTNTEQFPPSIFFFVFAINFIGFIWALSKFTKNQRQNVNLKKLHYYHTLRIFIELIFLYQLAQLKLISDVMTFEGRNFDVIIGLTAPLIIWLYFYKHKVSTKILIAWNIIGFLVLLFTVSQAILSAPFKFQQFSFDQPTVALLYFPFVWLPLFLVPMALTAHLLALKIIYERKIE